jgi:haloalkane dehalogenase
MLAADEAGDGTFLSLSESKVPRREEMMDVDAVRTPEELLEGLPDYPWESRYREVDGLRLAHLDEGEGRPVVFFHGEPTWSFLWRKVIPPIRDAGYRCVAPDYAGFGRSDKPTDVAWYTYDRHVELMALLLEELDLRDATVVVHQRMSDAWFAFRDFVRDNEDVPIGMLVRGGCKHDPGEDVIAAYDAPYVDPSSKAGARAFPLILPTTPDAVGAAEGKAVADGLRDDDRPSLVLWADSDPILPFSVGERVSSELNLTPPRAIAGAAHFLQEDAGPEIGAIIADWLG